MAAADGPYSDSVIRCPSEVPIPVGAAGYERSPLGIRPRLAIITHAMPSERIQHRIDALLDQADDAVELRDWPEVREICDAVLRLDPANEDARAYLEAADRDTGAATDGDGTTSPREAAGMERNSAARGVSLGR